MGLRYCISNKLPGDTDAAVPSPNLGNQEYRIQSFSEAEDDLGPNSPTHCLVLFPTGDIIINPFVARPKAVIYLRNLCQNHLGEL